MRSCCPAECGCCPSLADSLTVEQETEPLRLGANRLQVQCDPGQYLVLGNCMGNCMIDAPRLRLSLAEVQPHLEPDCAGLRTHRGSTGVDSGPMLFGAFSVQVIEALNWAGNDAPSSGKLEFVNPASNSFFPGQTVQATIDSNPQPILLTYGTTTSRYDWDNYLLVWPDDTQPNQWRLASFGGTASALAAESGRMVLELMAFINSNDLRIATAGAAGLDTACSPRPGAATGTRKIALANPDGELNPGDGLIVTYADCWIDDPTDNIDLLFSGSITLTGYIENRSPFATGFDQITFNSLTENETETAGQVVTVVQPPVVTTGTMTLFVTP